MRSESAAAARTDTSTDARRPWSGCNARRRSPPCTVAVVVVPAVEVTVRVRGAGEADLAPRAGAGRADARAGAGEGRAVAGAGGRRRAGTGGARAGPDAAGLRRGQRRRGERRRTAARRAEERDTLVGHHRRQWHRLPRATEVQATLHQRDVAGRDMQLASRDVPEPVTVSNRSFVGPKPQHVAA